MSNNNDKNKNKRIIEEVRDSNEEMDEAAAALLRLSQQNPGAPTDSSPPNVQSNVSVPTVSTAPTDTAQPQTVDQTLSDAPTESKTQTIDPPTTDITTDTGAAVTGTDSVYHLSEDQNIISEPSVLIHSSEDARTALTGAELIEYNTKRKSKQAKKAEPERRRRYSLRIQKRKAAEEKKKKEEEKRRQQEEQKKKQEEKTKKRTRTKITRPRRGI